MIHLVPPYKRRALCGEPKPASKSGWTRALDRTDCHECVVIWRSHHGFGFAETAKFLNYWFRRSFVWTAADVEEIVRGQTQRSR